MPQLDKFECFTACLICFSNIIAGILNMVWFPGEVATPLIIFGGASAIFFLFCAKSYEERSLSLLSFIFNNLVIFGVLQLPDPCSFLVGLFLILLIACHLFLWFGSDVFMHFLFGSVLLSRIFFHPITAEWGFGLVTELLFLRLYSRFFEVFRKKEERFGEESRIESLFYFFPLVGIAGWNLIHLHLDSGLKEMVIHINFLLAGASLIFLAFLAETITELLSSFLLYVILNIAIGYSLAEPVMRFWPVTVVFLYLNLFCVGFLLVKRNRRKKPLSWMLFSNKREGIQIPLIVYILVLGGLLAQLNPGAPALSPYSTWLTGLGIQIGFLTVLNYFFKD